jgi:hypothetical protein
MADEFLKRHHGLAKCAGFDIVTELSVRSHKDSPLPFEMEEGPGVKNGYRLLRQANGNNAVITALPGVGYPFRCAYGRIDDVPPDERRLMLTWALAI